MSRKAQSQPYQALLNADESISCRIIVLIALDSTVA